MSVPVNLRALPSALFQEVIAPDNVRARPMANSLSTLSFPKSRCALWDGSPTGDKMLLHLCAHRAPRVQLTEKALRLAQRHNRQSSKTLLRCFFLGSLCVDSDEEGVTVTLDRFDPGRDQSGVHVPSAALPGDVCASSVFTSDPSALFQSEAELHQAFKAVLQSISGRQSLDLSHILTLGLHVVWTQALDSADFSLTWSCVSPATGVHVEPVRAVHVIPTALLRSLTSPARPAANSRQNGFVTMDQSRKLLLLLESDPKALSLPLVGVWFSGATHVHSPQVWAWTLRFLYSSCIQDRVLSESGSFLLLLFTSTHRAPQFFQCKANGPELCYQLLTGHHTATLYQQVACMQGQTLECELSSEGSSRETEVFRRAHMAFRNSPTGVLSVVDQDSGVEDEDLSPRPSPSPHLPSAQQPGRIQPSVPELSMLNDGSFSNHDVAPAISKPQTLPPPSHRKSASPLCLHSTPYSNLQSSCACCKTNDYQYTTIHADGSTAGPNQLQSQLKTPLNCQHNSPIIQNVHQTQSNQHSSPSNHRLSPSNLRQSFANQLQTQPVLQNYKITNSPQIGSLPNLTPSQPASSPQKLTMPSPNYQTPILTSNVQSTVQNVLPSPLNPAQLTNYNYTIEQTTNVNQNHLKVPQLQSNPVLNLFHTPQNVETSASLSSTHLPSGNMGLIPQNVSQSPLSHPANLHAVPSSPHNLAAVPSFTSRSPSVMAPSCGHPVFTALPPPVACVSRCCEQQMALSSGEAYQLLLQQDRQLRLLQQQVQMLLETQGKFQSTQQNLTKITASIAVGTGASLFWPDPPPLRRDSSTSPPPVGCSVSPPHSPRPGSCEQPELGAERTTTTKAPSSPAASQNSLSSVDSPVLGESVSLYSPKEDQGSFYHNLRTQLNGYLQEEDQTKQEVKESKQETTQSKQEEEIQRSPNRPLSPANASLSCHSSSLVPGQVQSPVPNPGQVFAPVQWPKKKKKPRPSDLGGEDVVVSATLRRLQQLGVNLDKRELSESERARSKAVENASTLACINPAAVVSRLSAPGLSLLPHSSSSVDLSLEANAIALRYLSDQQLTHLSVSGHGPKSSLRSGPKHPDPVSMPSSRDMTILSPNMSLATRKYMKRYGLIEEESEDEEEQQVKGRPLYEALLPQSQLIRELKPKMQLLAGNGQNGVGGDENKENGNKENRTRRRQATESQGSVGNILDLSRLRQLPKLF